jgi:hypothetical protein
LTLTHLSNRAGAGSVGADRGSKVFFSEEKKQKIFANSVVCAAWKVRDSIEKKSFGSFFQKRTLSFSPSPQVTLKGRWY